MESLPKSVLGWVDVIREWKPGRAGELAELVAQPWETRDWAELERVLRLAIGVVAAGAFAEELQGLADDVDGRQREPGSKAAGRIMARCPRCQEQAPRHRERERKLKTTMGEVAFSRTEYHCSCGHLFAPADDKLGLRDEQRMSPHLLEMSERYGVENESFEAAARTFKDWIDGSAPSSSAIREHVVARAAQLDREMSELVAQGVRDSRSVPLLPWAGGPADTMVIEIDGGAVRLRKTAEGKWQLGWREAKLGAVYLLRDRIEKPPSEAQAKLGLPGRGKVTRCLEVARVGHWDESGFAAELYVLAVRMGLHRVGRVVLISDGALWIAELKQAYFPKAQHILDYWHAMEQVCKPARIAFGNNDVAFTAWRQARAADLMAGNVGAVCRSIAALTRRRQIAGSKAELKKLAGEARAFLTKRRAMLRPAEFKSAGLPVGSGLIEGRIKTVIQTRAKRPGMSWSLEGIQAILRLRPHLRNANYLPPTGTRAA